MFPEAAVPREALWTAKEAAEHLRCSKSFIYKAAERDRLPAIRIGRMLRFSPEAVRAFAGQPEVVGG